MDKCPYCEMTHGITPGKCPSVKAFEYYENGTVKRVEFYSPVDYMQPNQNILPPDQRRENTWQYPANYKDGIC